LFNMIIISIIVVSAGAGNKLEIHTPVKSSFSFCPVDWFCQTIWSFCIHIRTFNLQRANVFDQNTNSENHGIVVPNVIEP
jgi:hypothetical protein